MTSIGPDSLTVRFIIIGLYSLTPLISAVMIERHFMKSRMTLPRNEYGWVRFFLLPLFIFLVFLAGVMSATYIFGNIFHIAQLGVLATSMEELLPQFSAVIMPEQIKNIAEVGSVMWVYVLAIGAAVIAGWTICGVFGISEEYGWRGFLWDELKSLGVVWANLLTGLVWGLWHAPLILLSLNYGLTGWLGMLTMIVFTVSMSFVLSALRVKTQSIVPAAMLHGMINGSIYITALLFVADDPLIGGLTGMVAGGVVLIIGIVMWMYIIRVRKARAI